MNEILDDAEELAKDTSALLDSTTSAAGKRYDEARKALVGVMSGGRGIHGDARKRAIRETRAADGVMHDNLYRTILIGLGVGALLGYLLARQITRVRD